MTPQELEAQIEQATNLISSLPEMMRASVLSNEIVDLERCEPTMDEAIEAFEQIDTSDFDWDDEDQRVELVHMLILSGYRMAIGFLKENNVTSDDLDKIE